MISLTVIAGIALILAAVCILAAVITGCVFDFGPRLYRTAIGRALRPPMRALRHELVTLVAEHESRPPNRPAPRAAHCPGADGHGCGRFAHVTSSGEWGVRTRCKAHGIRVRRIHLIGERERTPLIVLSPVSIDTGPVQMTGPLIGVMDAIRPTYRLADGLDTLAAGIPLQHIRPIAA